MRHPLRVDPLDHDNFNVLFDLLVLPNPFASHTLVTRRERWQALRDASQALLTATPAGKARLLAAGAEPPVTPLTVDEIRERVCVIGQVDPFLSTVVAGLATVPACVQRAIVAEVAFIGVPSAEAFTCSSLFAGGDGKAKTIVVVVGADASPRLVRHECAHAWHKAPRDVGARRPAMVATAEEAVRAGADPSLAQLVIELERREELIVEACSVAWSDFWR